MKRFLVLCALTAWCGIATAHAVTPNEERPQSECRVDICVAPDVTVECTSCDDEFNREMMFIGEKRTYTRRFHSTGGSGMNVCYSWSVASDNTPVAQVLNNAAKKALYGPENIASLPGSDLTGSYCTTFSGSGPAYVAGSQYTELRAQVQAMSAGNATIVYTLTVNGYSF